MSMNTINEWFKDLNIVGAEIVPATEGDQKQTWDDMRTVMVHLENPNHRDVISITVVIPIQSAKDYSEVMNYLPIQEGTN